MTGKLTSHEYLKLFTTKNDQIGFWDDFFSINFNKPMKFLDIGPGNCDTIRSLQSKHKNIEFYSVDNSQTVVDYVKQFIFENSILSNACKMPFKNSFFDAINASSIFHEISTYGYISENGKIDGIEAIRAAVLENKRILKEGGTLFYRDVLSPEKQTFYKKDYNDTAVCYFLDLFLKDFTESTPYLYTENAKIEKRDGLYTIDASNFFHRDLQKHFLQCLENIAVFLLNFTETRIEDVSEIEGLTIAHKMFCYKVINQDDLELKEEVSQWLEREGKEKYLYLSLNYLVDLFESDIENTGFILKKIDTEYAKYGRIIRDAKTNFLSTIINNPETEGKQIAIFQKQKVT